MQVTDRIGRRMKLHDLNVLMAVVQAGSMSKAATLLNTTQSAISRSVADLEQTIGHGSSTAAARASSRRSTAARCSTAERRPSES